MQWKKNIPSGFHLRFSVGDFFYYYFSYIEQCLSDTIYSFRIIQAMVQKMLSITLNTQKQEEYSMLT